MRLFKRASQPVSSMSNGQLASIFQWLAIAASVIAALSGGIALHFRNKASVETADMLSETIGKRWPPLNASEIEALAKSFEIIPKYRVQLMYVNPLGKPLAESLRDAFVKAGWSDQIIFTDGGGNHTGIIAGPGANKANVLKSAIESATKLKIYVDKPAASEVPDLLYLSVGILR